MAQGLGNPSAEGASAGAQTLAAAPFGADPRGGSAEARRRAVRMFKLGLVLLTAAATLFLFDVSGDARRAEGRGPSRGEGGRNVTESVRPKPDLVEHLKSL